MGRGWDAADEWLVRHLVISVMLLPLMVLLLGIDELLSGPGRSGYPPCKSMRVGKGYEHLTELERFWWRQEQKARLI